jgi:hypothetical protein
MSTTTASPLTFNASDDHPAITPESVSAMIENGTTEKRAVAVILRDAGYTNQQVGDAFGGLFGVKTKSGGAGNLVTGGLRDLGRDGEIEITNGGGARRSAAVRDPQQVLRDELDRARAALDNVTRPAIEAQAALDAVEADPESIVAAHVAEIGERIKALQAEQKALKADPSAYLASERTRRQGRVDSARNAAGENEQRLRDAIAALESTLETIAG